jgi:hypothetical protein
MHEQIPSISNQRARNERATCDQIDQRKTNPFSPENCEIRVVWRRARSAISQPIQQISVTFFPFVVIFAVARLLYAVKESAP